MKLTVFTPTYNRRELLMKLYESLEKQTSKDFLWLIVDDGSTDGTADKIAEIKSDASFDIQYVYQENQGKHVAHNLGVELCSTELFVCVDSDDTLFEDAVESILNAHERYANENLLGYFFRKIDTNGNLSGGSVALDGKKVGLSDVKFVYGVVGEFVIVFRTELIKQYKFPSFEGERIVTENVLYNQLNDVAPMVWIEKTIYSYEYQIGGYSSNRNRIIAKNPNGTACSYISDAHFAKSLIQRIKHYSMFLSICRVFKLDEKELKTYKVKLNVSLPAILLIPHYDRIFKRIKQQNL